MSEESLGDLFPCHQSLDFHLRKPLAGSSSCSWQLSCSLTPDCGNHEDDGFFFSHLESVVTVSFDESHGLFRHSGSDFSHFSFCSALSMTGCSQKAGGTLYPRRSETLLSFLSTFLSPVEFSEMVDL